MNPPDAAFHHLRPSTTAEMLDRAYAVTVRIAPLLWGAAFISAAASFLLSLGMDHIERADSRNPYMVAGILPLVLVAEYALAVALLALFQGLIFPLRPLSAKALARTSLRKVPGFFLTNLLYLFLVIVLGVVAYAVYTFDEIPGNLYVRATTGLLIALFGIGIAIRLCLAPIICLIEDASPFPAFSRSWHLTSKRVRTSHRRADRPVFRWFAVAALPTALLLALAATFAAYAYLRLGIRAPIDWDNYSVSMLINVLEFACGCVAAPLYWSGLMALYVEYRMRHEALDFYLRLRDLRSKNGDSQTSVFQMDKGVKYPT